MSGINRVCPHCGTGMKRGVAVCNKCGKNRHEAITDRFERSAEGASSLNWVGVTAAEMRRRKR